MLNLQATRQEIKREVKVVTGTQRYAQRPQYGVGYAVGGNVEAQAQNIRGMAADVRAQVVEIVAREMSYEDAQALRQMVLNGEAAQAPRGAQRVENGFYPVLTAVKNISHPDLAPGEVIVTMFPTKTDSDGHKHPYARGARSYGKLTNWPVEKGPQFVLATDEEISTFFNHAVDRTLGYLIRSASPASGPAPVSLAKTPRQNRWW